MGYRLYIYIYIYIYGRIRLSLWLKMLRMGLVLLKSGGSSKNDRGLPANEVIMLDSKHLESPENDRGYPHFVDYKMNICLLPDSQWPKNDRGSCHFWMTKVRKCNRCDWFRRRTIGVPLSLQVWADQCCVTYDGERYGFLALKINLGLRATWNLWL